MTRTSPLFRPRQTGHDLRPIVVRGQRPGAMVVLMLSLLCLAAMVSDPVAAAPVRSGDHVIIATGMWSPYVEVRPCPEGGSGRSQPDQASHPKASPDESSRDNSSCELSVSGPLIDVVRRIFKPAGIKVEFVSHPWTRNAKLVESGVADAALPYYCSAARDKRFICSKTLIQGEMVLFKQRDARIVWDSLEELGAYTIGATLGYYYGERFEMLEALGELTVLRVAQDEVNMKLLARGLIDLFPQDKAVGYSMARRTLPESQWRKISHHPKPLHKRSLHVIFTRANPRGAYFSQIFDERLDELSRSGELEELLKPLRDLEIEPL